MARVSLNNETVELSEVRLHEAIRDWGYEPGKCAVALNGEFVPRADYAKVELKDGDELDVVAPVGGG